MMKIHLQLILAAIAPPTIGPSSSARAVTTDIFDTYLVYFSGGTSSKIIIVQREKHPPPPIP